VLLCFRYKTKILWPNDLLWRSTEIPSLWASTIVYHIQHRVVFSEAPTHKHAHKLRKASSETPFECYQLVRPLYVVQFYMQAQSPNQFSHYYIRLSIGLRFGHKNLDLNLQVNVRVTFGVLCMHIR